MLIVIAAVPYIDTNEPIMAPGLLKAVLKEKGIESTAIDLNIEIIQFIDKNQNKQKILDFFFYENLCLRAFVRIAFNYSLTIYNNWI